MVDLNKITIKVHFELTLQYSLVHLQHYENPLRQGKEYEGHQHFLKDRMSANNDSDQSGHLQRLIRVIALRSMGSQTTKLSLDVRQRFCIEYVNAQADLSLCLMNKQAKNLVGIAVSGSYNVYKIDLPSF